MVSSFFTVLNVISTPGGFCITFAVVLVPICLMPVVCRTFAHWFLVFHLSYYSISYRIGVLNSFIESLKGQTNSHLRIKRLRTCGYHFDQICLAANNINATFSFIMLINFTMMICVSTTSVFFHHLLILIQHCNPFHN